MLFTSTVHIAIAFDQNYLNPFYALVTSIFLNNRGCKIQIHAIVSGIADYQKKVISNFVESKNGLIHYYTIDQHEVVKFVLTNKWTSAVYYRLYFPLLVPSSVERLLYLDTDTLVLNNLSELYQVNMEGYPVAAVYDNWVKTAPQLGISKEGDYFNSGVLLIDLQKWNAQKISELAFEFLKRYPDKIKFVDQDALNAVLIGNWKKLDERFNFMYSLIPEGISRKQSKKLIADKVILHFTLQRPWFLLCKNRFRYLYFKYLDEFPAAKKSTIVDFELRKMPRLIKMRLVEFYFDIPALQNAWRKAKHFFFATHH